MRRVNLGFQTVCFRTNNNKKHYYAHEKVDSIIMNSDGTARRQITDTILLTPSLLCLGED